MTHYDTHNKQVKSRTLAPFTPGSQVVWTVTAQFIANWAPHAVQQLCNGVQLVLRAVPKDGIQDAMRRFHRSLQGARHDQPSFHLRVLLQKSCTQGLSQWMIAEITAVTRVFAGDCCAVQIQVPFLAQGSQDCFPRNFLKASHLLHHRSIELHWDFGWPYFTPTWNFPAAKQLAKQVIFFTGSSQAVKALAKFNAYIIYIYILCIYTAGVQDHLTHVLCNGTIWDHMRPYTMYNMYNYHVLCIFIFRPDIQGDWKTRRPSLAPGTASTENEQRILWTMRTSLHLSLTNPSCTFSHLWGFWASKASEASAL